VDIIPIPAEYVWCSGREFQRFFAFEPASLTLSIIREASILSAKRTLTGLYLVA